MSTSNYMDRPEEVEKYAAICVANGFTAPTDGARGLCQAMAAGDADVFDVIWKIWNFENAFDDLIDETGIGEDLKLTAIAALHDAIVEVFEPPFLDKLKRFYEVWCYLVEHTHWSKPRRHLAEVAYRQFFGMLRLNPFVRKHSGQLLAMLVQTMLRCISGDIMAKSANDRARTLAPAVRCGDVDMFHHIIYLARGFAAATAWCGKMGYDLADAPREGTRPTTGVKETK